ncbi:MAG: phage late control D family protein [Deltaproteobacteria bacterium]|nr:phage late control D family protein [Deltaproteobacteria bacterium]
MSGNEQPSAAPRFEVEIAGTKYTHAEPSGIKGFTVEDHVDMIGIAQIRFSAENSSWGSFKIGADVKISVGGSSRKVFVGQITAIRHSWGQGNQVVQVEAMDPLVKMAASRRTLVYEEKTDDQAVSAVISSSKATAGTVDSTSGTHKYIFQRNESDLNFAKRLAARNGYLLLANEGKIDFVKAQYSGSPVEFKEDQILHLDYTVSDFGIPPELTVIGWDYITKEKVEGTASSGAIVSIGGGANGVSEAKTWAETAYISDVLVTSQGGAQAMAEGELNRLARSFVRGKLIVNGNGALHAGVKIKTSGQRKGFNPTGFVIAARHTVELEERFVSEIHFVGNTAPE